jgi:anti-sigma factor RsiW
VRSLLSAYLDSELNGYEMLAVREHLSRCNDCADERESLRSVKLMLSSLPQREPRAEFDTQVCAHVRYISLPLYQRFRMALTTSIPTPTLTSRRVMSAAMLSVIGAFVAGGSFDHSVRDEAGVTLGSFATPITGRAFTAASYSDAAPNQRLIFLPKERLLDPRRYPFDLPSSQTSMVQLTSLQPMPRYNNVTLTSFHATNGDPVSSR